MGLMYLPTGRAGTNSEEEVGCSLLRGSSSKEVLKEKTTTTCYQDWNSDSQSASQLFLFHPAASPRVGSRSSFQNETSSQKGLG